jgi:hypothetical protein
VRDFLLDRAFREKLRRGAVAPVDTYLLGFDPEGDRVRVIGHDFQLDSRVERVAFIAILLPIETKCDSQQDHARDSKDVRSFHLFSF